MQGISNFRELALQLAKESNPKAKGMTVDSVVDEFLDGALVALSYTDTDGTPTECLVYFKDGEPRHFSNSTEMARYFGAFQRRSHWHSFIRAIQVAGMPGLLAFIILVTICYLTLMRNDSDVPEILANALTVILGFYFGRQSSRA